MIFYVEIIIIMSQEYIDIVKKYNNGEIKLDRNEVFKYLVAIELDAMLWKDAFKFFEKRIIDRIMTKIPDCSKSDIAEILDTINVDLVKNDLTETFIVKLGEPSRNDIFSFIAPSVKMLDIHHFNLVTDVTVDGEYSNYIDNIVKYDFDELLNKYI